MFVVDDVIFFPIRSLIWVFREIHQAAAADREGEGEAITAKLSELYMMLETGQITEAEFDAAEKELLDRLDVLKATSDTDGDEDEDEDEDGGEDGDEDEDGDEGEDEE